MSKVVDAVIGHAVGDAMGVPTEFCIREKLQNNPVTEMIGYGKFPVPAGSWSDDTSMSIATIDSIINCNGEININDIMKNFYYWLKDGKYSSIDEAFDVGRTCSCAISNYVKGIDINKCGLNDIKSNGNGSLMRIYPVALYAYYNNLKEDKLLNTVNEVSSLTHAHDISKLGCYIYVRYMLYLLNGISKEEAYEKIKDINYSSVYDIDTINSYSRILNDNIKNFKLDDIKSTGYIVDTLEASFWILLNSKDYKEAILTSTNIGNDTDTIGAITGSMAGIIYGVDSIPKEWLDKLGRRDYLFDLANKYERVLKK